MDIGTKPMKLSRTQADGTVDIFDIKADDHGNGKLYLKVDADIEVGDELFYVLPNGKTKTITITEVQVHEEPAGFGSGSLNHTKCLYDVSVARPKKQPTAVNIPGLHPLISAASGAQYTNGHHDDAVFNAFKAVEDRVKSLSGSALSGKPLMANVFNEQGPVLEVASKHSKGQQSADEVEGYKFLFMGASLGLRNPRGHGGALQTDEQEAKEMLALASLLMRALDRAEGRTPPKPAKKLPPKSLVPPGFATRAGGLS